MALTRIKKQSYESFLIYGDFTNVMTDNETITAFACSAEDNAGVDMTTVVLQPGSEIIGSGDDYAHLYVRVRDGVEAESPYKITIKVTTSTGNKWEVDGLLEIIEL